MQQPKIVFLGTGGDSAVVGKQLKASGGIIIQVDDSQFHLDPGPGALVRAAEYGINLRNNVAILCSHNHLNHCNDLNAVIDAMSLRGMDIHGVLVGNKTVINGNIVDGKEIEKSYLTEFHRKLMERVIALEAGKRVGINNIEIKATATKHSDPDCIGFRLLTPNFNMGYTSDTGYTRSLLEDFKDVDLLILNVQNPDDISDEYHLCSHEAIKIINETKPKLAIVTHFGAKMVDADVLTQARFIQKETNVQTIAARDGMVINPISYSVNLRQKTLNLFK